MNPRNVRCTQAGFGKLIDFGAMVPMGSHAQVVGTPPFVAPEALHTTLLDARTDLFSRYRELSGISEPPERLLRALSGAGARHTAATERDRVYAPDEAIRLLVLYVALSIAESSRGFNMALVASLPELLEPFASLSPLVAAIWQNAIAAVESLLGDLTDR